MLSWFGLLDGETNHFDKAQAVPWGISATKKSRKKSWKKTSYETKKNQRYIWPWILIALKARTNSLDLKNGRVFLFMLSKVFEEHKFSLDAR